MFPRVLTSPIRLMPDFIIIGAQRCGTTSLYNYLTTHPCIVPAVMKEIHFFDLNFRKGVTWYRAHFPSLLYRYFVKQRQGQDIITGEASPYYFLHPLVPKRVSEILPRVKLIALLRNPVDRAYSHYYQMVGYGDEPLSFEDAIQREAERLSNEVEKIVADENYYSFNHQVYSYLARGIYIDQLKVWRSFFPKNRILILKSEDFFTNPQAIFKQILVFLELPNWEPKEPRKYNQSKYPKMNATTRKRLLSYFEPHNQRLYEYLGVNFGWYR